MSATRSRNASAGPAPFRPADATALDPRKFRDLNRTADGEPRAVVGMRRLETLWFNTGTLCNLACANCYIASSPTNDALIYLTAAEAARFLDELGAAPCEIGFTGGEPFMNPDIIAMLEDALGRGHRVLVLTNAMKPMRRHAAALVALRTRYGDRLALRVSADHHTKAVHEAERGPGSWAVMLDGLRWLSRAGFALAVAGRHLAGESEDEARSGYASLFARETIAVPALDPARLILFPEMDEEADIAEITTRCWSILGKSPADLMCASSRMVVHRRGEPHARVVACTLIPHDARFDLGASLGEAARPVALAHPHCARFCVLGGASCTV